ncbi:MAG TPA: SDR family oxidoreductase [Solirubrobacteraceae bacterium]|jgi:3-oxoacyl-[acyl-carrier protein] reductase|nr:SDR family oxidoreductase [Solirubrobacteraceae bacterium]
MNLLDLTGRTAIVTGAGQGVGRAIAEHLSAHGARVAVNDYVAGRAEAVAGAIRAAGGTAIAVPGDVTELSAVMALADRAVGELGPVDVLVNNAGNAGAATSKVTQRPFWETDPAEWDAFIGVNLLGPLNCARAVLPAMVEAGRGGRLITIISDAGRVGEPGLEAYSAAKAGAAGLTRALARTLGRFEITANCIAIAATRTPATERWVADEEHVKKMLRNYVIRRIGEPDEIAAMATFLASSAAGWITGQTYPVNGGFSFNL